MEVTVPLPTLAIAILNVLAEPPPPPAAPPPPPAAPPPPPPPPVAVESFCVLLVPVEMHGIPLHF